MESKIIVSESGTMYVGREATSLAAAIMLKGALRLHVRTNGAMRVTRTATPTMLLRRAGELTGKAYKRGQHALALADVEAHIKAMHVTIPVEAR